MADAEREANRFLRQYPGFASLIQAANAGPRSTPETRRAVLQISEELRRLIRTNAFIRRDQIDAALIPLFTRLGVTMINNVLQGNAVLNQILNYRLANGTITQERLGRDLQTALRVGQYQFERIIRDFCMMLIEGEKPLFLNNIAQQFVRNGKPAVANFIRTELNLPQNANISSALYQYFVLLISRGLNVRDIMNTMYQSFERAFLQASSNQGPAAAAALRDVLHDRLASPSVGDAAIAAHMAAVIAAPPDPSVDPAAARAAAARAAAPARPVAAASSEDSEEGTAAEGFPEDLVCGDGWEGLGIAEVRRPGERNPDRLFYTEEQFREFYKETWRQHWRNAERIDQACGGGAAAPPPPPPPPAAERMDSGQVAASLGLTREEARQLIDSGAMNPDPSPGPPPPGPPPPGPPPPPPGPPPQEDQSENCTICLGPLVDPDDPPGTTEVSVLPCGHMFHTECLQGWRRTGNSTCPVCRAPTRTADITRVMMGGRKKRRGKSKTKKIKLRKNRTTRNKRKPKVVKLNVKIKRNKRKTRSKRKNLKKSKRKAK